MHLTSLDEVRQQLEQEQEDLKVKKIQETQKQKLQPGSQQNEIMFDFRRINYLETSKRNLNYSYMQSICLIAAYLSGAVKENHDTKVIK
jgi:TolA-binding protein